MSDPFVVAGEEWGTAVDLFLSLWGRVMFR